VAMDSSYKTYVETDLASGHYVTFIEPFVVCPTDALSFDSDEFTNNNMNKMIEEKKMILSNLILKIYYMKLSGSSQNHNVSGKIFVNDKLYKVILIIFLL
jgi:hypothetical protein